jgi:hypothetical protein
MGDLTKEQRVTADIASLLNIVPEQEPIKKEEKPVGIQAITPDKLKEEESPVATEVVESTEEEKEVIPTSNLLSELARLSSLLTPKSSEPNKEVEVPEEKKTEEKVKPEVKPELKPTSETLEFFDPKAFSDLLEEKDVNTLKGAFTKVLETAVLQSRKAALQDVMGVIPQMIQYTVQGALAAQAFWGENPQLKKLVSEQPGLKQYVEYRASEIEKQEPGLNLGQVYGKLRTELQGLLKPYLTESEGSKLKAPALARAPGAKRATADVGGNLSATQKQILELMNLSK